MPKNWRDLPLAAIFVSYAGCYRCWAANNVGNDDSQE
jgi:hypothetical protein